MAWQDNVHDFLHGMAYGRYERELRMQANQLNDLFLLLCYMESGRAAESSDALPARRVSLPVGTIPSLASADGHGTIAARQSSVLLAA